MSYPASRTFALSLALLMAGTSLSHAGFIWIAPENEQPAEAAPVPEAPVPMEAAPAAVEPAPMTMAPAPAATEPAPVVQAPPQAVLAPITMSSAPMPAEAAPAPAPVMDAPVTAAPPEAAPAAPIELRPAPVSEAAPAPLEAPAAPVAEAEPAPMAPLVSAPAAGGGATAANSMPNAEAMMSTMPSATAPKAAPAVVEAAAPVVAEPAPVATAPTPEPTAPRQAVSMVTGTSMTSTTPAAAAKGDQMAVVNGFGTQVPLIIALRQILPSDYGFAHSDGVDLTQFTNWEGGKPWPEVLKNTLSPLGLKSTITGDTVLIEKSDSSVASNAAPAPVTLAPALEAPTAAPTNTGMKAVLVNATMMQTPPAN